MQASNPGDEESGKEKKEKRLARAEGDETPRIGGRRTGVKKERIRGGGGGHWGGGVLAPQARLDQSLLRQK